MKQTHAKQYILTVAQLLIALLQLVMVGIGYVLSWTDNLLLKGRTYLMSRTCASANEADNLGQPRNRAYGWAYGVITSGDADRIEKLRKKLESTPEGRAVVEENRRLYAVAQPNHQENLLRIEHIINRLNNEALTEVLLKIQPTV